MPFWLFFRYVDFICAMCLLPAMSPLFCFGAEKSAKWQNSVYRPGPMLPPEWAPKSPTADDPTYQSLIYPGAILQLKYPKGVPSEVEYEIHDNRVIDFYFRKPVTLGWHMISGDYSYDPDTDASSASVLFRNEKQDLQFVVQIKGPIKGTTHSTHVTIISPDRGSKNIYKVLGQDLSNGYPSCDAPTYIHIESACTDGEFVYATIRSDRTQVDGFREYIAVPGNERQRSATGVIKDLKPDNAGLLHIRLHYSSDTTRYRLYLDQFIAGIHCWNSHPISAPITYCPGSRWRFWRFWPFSTY